MKYLWLPNTDLARLVSSASITGPVPILIKKYVAVPGENESGDDSEGDGDEAVGENADGERY